MLTRSSSLSSWSYSLLAGLSTRSGLSLSLLALPPPFSLPLENKCLPREETARPGVRANTRARALRGPGEVAGLLRGDGPRLSCPGLSESSGEWKILELKGVEEGREGTLAGQEGVEGMLASLSEAELSRGAAREEPELERVRSCSSSSEKQSM